MSCFVANLAVKCATHSGTGAVGIPRLAAKTPSVACFPSCGAPGVSAGWCSEGEPHMGNKRRRVEPTEDWEQIELLCGWPEQRDYELTRPSVLFGSPASERAKETGATSERTLQRRVVRFEAEGMESLFGSEAARRRGLPPSAVSSWT
jgi:hypothetical protein